MLSYIYFKDTKNTIPVHKSDLIKGSLSLGMIIGQIGFGILGDTLGRHRVYGKELIITMFGTLMCILLPWKGLSHDSIIAWMSVFRVVTGMGIGGGTKTFDNFHLSSDIIRLPNVFFVVSRKNSTRKSSCSSTFSVFMHWTWSN